MNFCHLPSTDFFSSKINHFEKLFQEHYQGVKQYGFRTSDPQGFNLASAIGHSPKIVPDVREFAVLFRQFVRDDFRRHTLYVNVQ